MRTGLQGDFLEGLVASCPDAIIYADREGKIRFWNASATRIFGFAEIEALGQSLDLIVPEGLRARHWEGYDRVMAGGGEPLWRRRRAVGPGDAQGRQTDFDRIHRAAAARRRRRAARHRRVPARRDRPVRGIARAAPRACRAQGAPVGAAGVIGGRPPDIGTPARPMPRPRLRLRRMLATDWAATIGLGDPLLVDCPWLTKILPSDTGSIACSSTRRLTEM